MPTTPAVRDTDQWVGLALTDADYALAEVRQMAGERPRVLRMATGPRPQSWSHWQALRRRHELGAVPVVLVLPVAAYRLLGADAPELPRADWPDAMRWRIKDAVDFPVEDAAIDVLAVPPADPSAPVRSAWVAAAPAATIKPLAEDCQTARVPLEAIDIVETALRNLCALDGDADRARALLWVGPQQAILVVTLRGELLLSRRIDITADLLAHDDAGLRQQAADRLALELQRTLDLCERQFSHANVAGLALLPGPAAQSLCDELGQVLYVPVSLMPLDERLDLSSVTGQALPELLARHLVALGAALRQTTEAPA
ncbi:agglutinin biogenesis protein MshI [Ideonella sp. 4Y11]|uniref:Agglutinin biogenesis protein MshI n=1 Tax=Ideonella aquatica TaxID=2824119 RepID=A0A941BQ79_9BURK|nr:agglutinin biogenesis protein MshI [Ideonella aquatica]MBQ0958830.1 agglutinin biogenesis protein MshI [Ideonella aquatica]